MKIVRILLIIIFLLSNKVAGQNFENSAERIMSRDSIPEMTFAVVTKDSILVKSILGHHEIKELEGRSNANVKDFFHLGSNTKAITGFLAGYLVEKGKIKWSTKFFDLFPEFKKKSNPGYYDITLEDLLSHRAKMQSFTSGSEYRILPKFKGNKSEKRKQFVQHLLTILPVETHEKYHYSNAGYSIAALMLEKVSGESWEDLMKEVLTKKLKIDFVFGWPNRNFKEQPYGHWIEKGKIVSVPADIEYNLDLAEPAGDISMDIENYAKFIQLNIKGLSGENNFLKATTYKFLHDAKDEYAIGWGNYKKGGKLISEHAGSDGTFFCYVQIDRKKMIGYIVIVNSGTEAAQNGVYEMVNILKKKF